MRRTHWDEEAAATGCRIEGNLLESTQIRREQAPAPLSGAIFAEVCCRGKRFEPLVTIGYGA